jgi:hypothetical protein
MVTIVRILLGLLLIASFSSHLLAQDADEAAEDDQQQRLRKLLDESVTWFEFTHETQPTRPLPAKTVMRWTNNARASVDGLTVIWISPQGRPAAIAAIYPYGEMFCLEFDSLSRDSFKVTRDGSPFWSPEKPGLEFASLKEAPVPADSKPARLLQMKRLARQFDATMLGWSTKVNQREELRLLPRPLYQYEIQTPQDVLDGALFAFASGTDPEAVLVIEAVGASGQYHWEYAFARRTSGALEARLGDQVVWQAKAYPEGGNPQNVHRGGRQPLAPLLQKQQ